MNCLMVVRDSIFGEGLKSLLAKEPDFEHLSQVNTANEAFSKVESLRPELVLIDVSLPDSNGFAVLKSVVAHYPQTAAVMLSDEESDEALFEAIRLGARGLLLKRSSFPHILAALRAVQQGEVAFSRVMTSRLVSEFRRLSNAPEFVPKAFSTLTSREMEVLSRIGAGASNREIARDLVVSEHTIKVHVRHILAKLNLKNRAQVANLARYYGLAKPNHNAVHKTNIAP